MKDYCVLHCHRNKRHANQPMKSAQRTNECLCKSSSCAMTIRNTFACERDCPFSRSFILILTSVWQYQELTTVTRAI